jgi:predicted HAD superfamily phosphohydrolase YqeG
MNMRIVGVDFDGTIVEHQYPNIGPEVDGAIDWLRRLQAANVKLMLWTMRDNQTLTAAVAYCAARGITFWGVNSNPEQSGWSSSTKQFAHAYIDDAAIGCPLTTPAGGRPFADWSIIGPMVWDTLGLPPHNAGGTDQ